MAVVFNAAEFVGLYPVFAPYNTANPTGLQNFFNQATLFLSNADDPCAVVSNVDKRKQLLYLLTAHIAQLMGVLSADGQPVPPGRVSMAREMDVEVRTELPMPKDASKSWYMQTQYGTTYWAATAALRAAVYVPGPPLFARTPWGCRPWRR